MRVRMLGTGYADCSHAKQPNDRRRMGGVIVDDKILIDAPRDLYELADDIGMSRIYKEIRHIVISHSHPSHFDQSVIARIAREADVTVYASEAVLRMCPSGVRRRELVPFTMIDIDGYRLIPLPANHTTDIADEVVLNFILMRDRTLFYGLDGGGICTDAWRLMRQIPLDVALFDCALGCDGASEKYLYHNSISQIEIMKNIMQSIGVITEHTRIILTHLPCARQYSVYEQLAPMARDMGFTLAYDGYFINI